MGGKRSFFKNAGAERGKKKSSKKVRSRMRVEGPGNDRKLAESFTVCICVSENCP